MKAVSTISVAALIASAVMLFAANALAVMLPGNSTLPPIRRSTAIQDEPFQLRVST